MIVEAQGARFVVLHGTGCTAVLELAEDSAPLWRYWGPRLPDRALPGPPLRAARALPSFTLDVDPPLSLFPTFGLGWFGHSALLAHRSGRAFAQGVTACEVASPTPGRSARFRLTDAVAALAITIDLDLDPASDVLSLSTTLENTGEDLLEVQWLAAGVIPLGADAATVRSFTGRHNSEFVAVEDALGPAAWRRENRRGLTSHDCFPGAVVLARGAGAFAGTVWAAQLAWSGNSAQQIEPVDDGRFQWQMGEWLAPGEGRLAPGETLSAPTMLATVSAAGCNGAAQNFHAAIRARLPWPGGRMRPRPVGLNTWEGRYFDHRLDDLKRLAGSAAALGVERFVLDDGWFAGRDDDTRALGDWRPDPVKYPHGLAPLADHVVALGMEFGLWVEPEMVNPDSDLFRAHPDWALQLDGRPLLTGRNQLVLDLARPEVADHLFALLAALLADLPIAYLKWDHNRDLAAAGGPDGRARYRAQVRAAWALMDRLRAAFPALEIESCAGGGGRIDAGVLAHTHRVWTSDCIDATARLSMQRGFLQFFPPEIMGAHVGAAPAHATGRAQSMRWRAAVAFGGHLGVELDPAALDPAARETLAAWIAFHKALRPRLHQGRVWQGEAGDGQWFVGHGDADGLLLCLYRRDPAALRHAPALALPMLAADRSYRVTRIDPTGPRKGGPARAPVFAALRGEGVTFSGAWLARAGLPVPPMMAETCAVFDLQPVA